MLNTDIKIEAVKEPKAEFITLAYKIPYGHLTSSKKEKINRANRNWMNLMSKYVDLYYADLNNLQERGKSKFYNQFYDWQKDHGYGLSKTTLSAISKKAAEHVKTAKSGYESLAARYKQKAGRYQWRIDRIEEKSEKRVQDGKSPYTKSDLKNIEKFKKSLKSSSGKVALINEHKKRKYFPKPSIPRNNAMSFEHNGLSSVELANSCSDFDFVLVVKIWEKDFMSIPFRITHHVKKLFSKAYIMSGGHEIDVSRSNWSRLTKSDWYDVMKNHLSPSVKIDTAKEMIQLVVKIPCRNHKVFSGVTLGIDIGINSFIYISDGDITHGKPGSSLNKKVYGEDTIRNLIASGTHKVDCRKRVLNVPAQNGWWTTRKNTSGRRHIKSPSCSENKVKETISNYSNRIAKQICKDIDDQFGGQRVRIAIEDLKDIKSGDMSESKGKRMNKKVRKWPVVAFFETLEKVAKIHGHEVVKVSPKYTSQTCPKCNHVEKGNRNGNEFQCRKCQFKEHADYVGSINVARKGKMKK